MGVALSLYDAVKPFEHAAGGLRVVANLSAGLPLLKVLADVTPPGGNTLKLWT